MFEEETVFVIGAGANLYYDFPLGNKLIEQIVNDMDDQIFIPIHSKEKNNFYFNDSPYGQKETYPVEWLNNSLDFNFNDVHPSRVTNLLDPQVCVKRYGFDIVDLTKPHGSLSVTVGSGKILITVDSDIATIRIAPFDSSTQPSLYKVESLSKLGIPASEIFNAKDSDSMQKVFKQLFVEDPIGRKKLFSNVSRLFSYKNTLFVKTKIKNINGFNKLYNLLKDFNSVSIDVFLRDNPEYEIPAKSMIIYSLLKLEKIEKLQTPNAGIGSKGNWYPYLLNDITSGCANNPQNLLDNKLSIITFNYDVSLDYFLKDKLIKTQIFKHDNIGEQYMSEDYNPIIHVYGSLDFSGRKSYAYYRDEEKSHNKFKNKLIKKCDNYFRLHAAYQSYNTIETMEQERKSQHDKNRQEKIKKVKEKIKYAKQIIFIGFAFDRSNLDQLGLPIDLESWKEFCLNKQIKWLNYKGSMKGLAADFSIIDEKRQHIVESTADDIVNAYQNDFKISLFKNLLFYKDNSCTISVYRRATTQLCNSIKF